VGFGARPASIWIHIYIHIHKYTYEDTYIHIYNCTYIHLALRCGRHVVEERRRLQPLLPCLGHLIQGLQFRVQELGFEFGV